MLKFLVVDDDADLASIVAEKMKSLGNCTVCSSGHEAMRILGTQSFAAVITDYIMQGGDGGSLAHYCTNHKIPVLVVSSFPEGQIRPYLPDTTLFVNKYHAVRGNMLQESIKSLLPGRVKASYGTE